MASKYEEKKSDQISGEIISTQLGIWKIQIMKNSLDLYGYLDHLRSSLPLIYNISYEIYRITPRLSILFFLSKIWSGIESALLMHLSSDLLRAIEASVISGRLDTYAIVKATCYRLGCVLIVAFLEWLGSRVSAQLKMRAIFHFNVLLMKASLRIDLPTLQDPGSQIESTAEGAWNAVGRIVFFFTQLLTTVSELVVIVHIARSSGGPLFALLCLAKPILGFFSKQNLWNQEFVAHVNNFQYRRMKAMKKLTSDEYREDIIRGELGPYILKEYSKAIKNLGNTETDHPFYQFDRQTTPYFRMMQEFIGDLPIVYCALYAILYPSKFSVASIAILQQSSNTLRYSIEVVFNSTESFRKGVNTLNSIYATSKIRNLIQDGNCSYPSAERSCESGMALELKNVTFDYPGSKNTSSVLRDVSLSIKPGQLVVIVGENGSGKSTIIKILTRLYDPTSGEVHIDGMPSSHYCMADLHHSTAVLSQDNHMYPLSLSENIGLGYVDHVDDATMISKAAEQGGASSFISKLEKGIDTFLDPSLEQFAWNLQGKPDHPLSKELKSLEKTVDISGGERQRLVASRAFMRFNSGKVKFVAVDEPSSALDAEGELRLFQNLIEVRAGKTMIFVTHRFGHLTRYADQIICMKEGKVVEMGTHQSLMKADGEYAKLYNIQASAFSDTAQ